MMFRKFFERRRFARDSARFVQGYNFAAGELLRGSSNAGQIRVCVAESRAFGEFDTFDEGAMTAVLDWERKVPGVRT